MEKNNSEIIIYQTEDGATKVNVRLDDNSVWLTQGDLVELFQSSKSNISEHIKHIFEEGELNEAAVVRKFRTTGSYWRKLKQRLNQEGSEVVTFCHGLRLEAADGISVQNFSFCVFNA